MTSSIPEMIIIGVAAISIPVHRISFQTRNLLAKTWPQIILDLSINTFLYMTFLATSRQFTCYQNSHHQLLNFHQRLSTANKPRRGRGEIIKKSATKLLTSNKELVNACYLQSRLIAKLLRLTCGGRFCGVWLDLYRLQESCGEKGWVRVKEFNVRILINYLFLLFTRILTNNFFFHLHEQLQITYFYHYSIFISQYSSSLFHK